MKGMKAASGGKGVKMYGIRNGSGSKPITAKGNGNTNHSMSQAPRNFKSGGAAKMK